MLHSAIRQSPRRTPTLARIFAAALFAATLALTSAAHAQGLGEDDVIRLAKTQDPSALVARAQIAMAKVAVEEARVRKNPSLSFDHEHFPGGDAAEAEDAIVLTLPIDLSHRRASQKQLAESGIATASAAAARAQSAAVVRSLQLFYRLLAQEEELQIEESSMARLSEAAQIVKRQKEEGKVSGYDQIRIEIELEVRQSQQRQTQLDISQMRRELASLLGLQGEEAGFKGSLDVHARSSQNEKPPISLSFLRMAVTQATKARRSATRRWLPTVQLTAGPRLGFGGDTRYGYVAGISVELPFYSKNEALQSRARAEVSLAEARVQKAEIITKRRHIQAEEVMQAAQQEAKRFEEATASLIDRLERAAASRYREGQSIIELLDAQRTRSQVGKRRLQLRLQAKEAEVALRAARGEFE
jgi:cobalt-zinc-cadmium efflux system outer membrane protein